MASPKIPNGRLCNDSRESEGSTLSTANLIGVSDWTPGKTFVIQENHGR